MLDGGRIVELGTHDELVALDGLYAAQLRAGELLDIADDAGSGDRMSDGRRSPTCASSTSRR